MTSDVQTGSDVLEWFETPDAAGSARRIADRVGLKADPMVADDVLQNARMSVLIRMRNGPLVVDNPAAYGTTVLRQAAIRIAQGRDDTDELPPDADLGDRRHLVPAASSGDPTGTTVVDGDRAAAAAQLDDLRVVVERTAVPQPWVTSAMLSLVILWAHPDVRIDGVPAPRAGARPDQALLWTALWFAGQRLHFPAEGDDHQTRNRKNQARSRMQRQVSAHYEAARRAFLDEYGADHG